MISLRYWSSEPKRRWPSLGVRGIGIREEMLPCIVQRPGGTGDYLFMLFHDEIKIGPPADVKTHPPGTLMIWSPGDAHYYGNPSHKWRHSWLHCEGPDVRQMMHSIGPPLRRPTVLADPSRCDKYLFDLYEEVNVRATADRVIAANVIENWLRDISRQLAGEGRGTAVPAEFATIKTYIESHTADALSLTALADRVGFSVPHFCARFKQLFGVPPIAFQLRLRLHLAASLLRDTTLSVKEVSRRVGYRDVYYFSRHFKRQFGISPKHLRTLPGNRIATLHR